MKILIIENSIGTTGAMTSILGSTKPLNSEHTFLFAIPTGSLAKQKIEEHGYKIFEIPFREINRNLSNNLMYPFTLIRNAYRIKKIVLSEKIDIIQTNDIYNLSGIVCKLFTKVKVITHIRRMPESFPSKLYKLWTVIHLKFADKIIPVSHANNKVFEHSSKSEVLYNGLPSYSQSFEYKTTNSKELYILYLANYMNGKGQNHAVQTINRLKDLGHPYHLYFFGDTNNNENNIKFLADLKQLAKDLHLTDKITFCGGSTNIVENLSNADIMLNFSDSESLSRITMEALYFGVPIIATNVGGTNEMIVDGWNGLLVEPKNIEQMTEALTLLISDENKRDSFSKNGQEYIRAKFNRDVLTEQLRKIYSSL